MLDQHEPVRGRVRESSLRALPAGARRAARRDRWKADHHAAPGRCAGALPPAIGLPSGFPGRAMTRQRPDVRSARDRRRAEGARPGRGEDPKPGGDSRSDDVDVSTGDRTGPRERDPPAPRRPRRPSRSRTHWAASGRVAPSRPAISTTSWLTVIEFRCRSLRRRLSSFTDHDGNSALAATWPRTSSSTESARTERDATERAGSGELVGGSGAAFAHNSVSGPARTGWQRSEVAS